MSGSFTGLVGLSGAGKTQLLKIIAGLKKPDHGTVTLGTHKLGFAFQDSNLIPWLTVRKNLEVSYKKSSDADHWLSSMGLEHAADFFPEQLSGGMKKRVNLIRALGGQPELLLLDEPFEGLDDAHKSFLYVQILDFWKSTQSTVLLVSHNIQEVILLAQKIYVLSSKSPNGYEDFAVGAHSFSQPEDCKLSLEDLNVFEKIQRQLLAEFKATDSV